MVLVSKSEGMCGACGERIEIEWDLDLVSSSRREDGISNYYESCENWQCDRCGNTLEARLWAAEYPEGVLKDAGVEILSETSGSSMSTIEIPKIRFYDL